MPTKDDMIRKRDWAKEKTLEAVRNGNFSEAEKFSGISDSYEIAASRISRGLTKW